MSKNNLCTETCRIMLIKTTSKSKLNSVNSQLGSLRMALFVKMPLIVFRLARPIFRLILRYHSNYCISAQYTISMNNLCHEKCRAMFIFQDDCEIEVLAHSSRNGAIGQNTLYSFSSSAFNFHGPNWPFRYDIPTA